MKISIISIFFYLLIAFAIYQLNSIYPLLALIFSPIIFDSLSKNEDVKNIENGDNKNNDDNLEIKQLNS